VSTNAKINNPDVKRMKILVAPLDWGLGHATRCIPVIKELINQQCEVWIAAAGAQRALLQVEFPFLPFVELPGYKIKYGKNRAFTILRLLCLVPKILIRIKQENAWLRGFAAAERPDAIISDNRYGLYLPGLVCVFITHQLHIHTPFGRLADGWLQKINYRAIRSFSRCWVPDIQGPGSLAGELSHPARMPHISTRYIGWLSRFEGRRREGAPPVRPGETERPGSLLVLLSGPEPQRTLLEQKILEQAVSYNGNIILVRGLPGGRGAGSRTGGSRTGAKAEGAYGPTEGTPTVRRGGAMVIYDHLPAKDLEPLIREAEVVLSRAGYSTVMDLMKMGKRAVLIPTPGQSEQEYLGAYLAGSGRVVCILQSDLLLPEAVAMARSFACTGIGRDEGGGDEGAGTAGSEGGDLLRREVRSLLEELHTGQSAPDFG
jgi:hypothetical protein